MTSYQLACSSSQKLNEEGAELTVMTPYDSMTEISIFLAPVWTTSNNDLTVNLIVSSRDGSSV